MSPASTDLDRRLPRPRKDSRVRLFRTARWEAYVAGFSGFATPPRWARGGQGGATWDDDENSVM